jgi:hypothetical protein
MAQITGADRICWMSASDAAAPRAGGGKSHVHGETDPLLRLLRGIIDFRPGRLSDDQNIDACPEAGPRRRGSAPSPRIDGRHHPFKGTIKSCGERASGSCQLLRAGPWHSTAVRRGTRDSGSHCRGAACGRRPEIARLAPKIADD